MFKKTILISALLSSFLMASDIDMGVGYLSQEMTGTITVKPDISGVDSVSINDDKGTTSDNVYAYIDIKAIPFFPNVKFDYIAPSFNSDRLSATYTGTAGTGTTTTDGSYALDSTQIGGYLYYNVLAWTDFARLDLGIGAKYVDYTLDVVDNSTGTILYQDSDTVFIPVAYVHPEITLFDVSIGAEGKGVSYDGDTYYEVKAGLGYAFDLPVGKLGLEGGYYYSKLKTADDSSLFNDTDIDITTDGWYAGINYQF